MSKNLYQVRIDGEIMPNSFTYEELLLNEIFEFDDIYIKNVYNQYWCKVSEFTFPEEQDPAYLEGIGESKEVSQSTFEIDDCGQVINRGNIIQTSDITSSSSNTSSNSNQNHSNQSSEDSSLWKIIFTIIAIIIVIILFCNNVISGTVAAICGVMIIIQIWQD